MRVRVAELRERLVGYVRMLEEDNAWVGGASSSLQWDHCYNPRRFRDFQPNVVGGEKGPGLHIRTTSTHTNHPHEFQVSTCTWTVWRTVDCKI